MEGGSRKLSAFVLVSIIVMRCITFTLEHKMVHVMRGDVYMSVLNRECTPPMLCTFLYGRHVL